MKFLFVSFLLYQFSCFSETSFTTGSGSKYKVYSKSGPELNLSIYITESSFARLGVEYYISGGDPLSLSHSQMWQQFILERRGDGPLSIVSGYIKSHEIKTPEILTDEFLNQNRGVQVSDFLFKEKKEMNKFKISEEVIETAAGSITATHYKKTNQGQVVDFWISEQALPIGLVKLVSQGKEKSHNYTVEIQSLIKNVKPAIDKKKAVPLSEKGKLLLNMSL